MALSKLQRSYDESEELLPEKIGYDQSTDDSIKQKGSGPPQRLYYALLTVVILILISLILNIYIILSYHDKQCSPRKILKESNFYSPALETINPYLPNVRFNGNFGLKSRWQGEPSPEVDAAWNEVSNIRVGRASEEELMKSGFSTDHVKIPEENGGGYLIEFEISHQLHCLDMLRMTSFYNFAHYHALYPSWIVDHPDLRGHVGHCTEMLRQALMCNADLGIIPMVWASNWTLPIPDFNTWHKCKNWDSALAFARGRSLPSMKIWGPQEGEKILHDPLGLHNEEARRRYKARLDEIGLSNEI